MPASAFSSTLLSRASITQVPCDTLLVCSFAVVRRQSMSEFDLLGVGYAMHHHGQVRLRADNPLRDHLVLRAGIVEYRDRKNVTRSSLR